MTDKVAVKFLTAHTVGTLYNKGDVAGFDGKTAADLIEREIAEAVKGKKATKPDAPTAKKVGETWSVFSGADVLVADLVDEAAATAWIADQPKV